jgi:hypothetical protein
MAQVNNQKLTNASEVFVDTDGRFFPVVYSVAPLHGGYDHGAVIVSHPSLTAIRIRAGDNRVDPFVCPPHLATRVGVQGRLGRSIPPGRSNAGSPYERTEIGQDQTGRVFETKHGRLYRLFVP